MVVASFLILIVVKVTKSETTLWLALCNHHRHVGCVQLLFRKAWKATVVARQRRVVFSLQCQQIVLKQRTTVIARHWKVAFRMRSRWLMRMDMMR